ncbi:nucleotidyl transferase AbiEii/AbiGii toxin family protein [Enterococcus cecorum]|uniref:nucleotidyl transferase AbiEii/AbiGii toxin family protein n=3 Tax=Enterococcus cecorum TaxID=44008 RepID=UPI000AC74932|nr:nucleotidyl transferase AbiEii/AbiGii toxin family protein [Enterococcus cecorum]MCJ0567328.1 nucleotidyl transferase AbiEii/AbiGii toxin family protein [Enterococcus cecorum]MCJ0594918.1 nucleotidyl transferase AbiEii/AbiGii toxin family protein [Enterococcus cecorum]MDZ5561001.1 nucleotidyl transferase AbiEii/AbiGii toxin family protein [Enterococcus cecorum]MDZ5584451.1 nucleotidyl transferase AbiEii/AbiGii toxin family protein [Enterococcus cecorum]CAI3414051.1 nucleotidyl transferase A
MNFTNANSFKAKIKNIAKEKDVPPQQIQQSYLIEQVLRMISKSVYKNHFIVKGGYLIGNMIGVEKRTTMDLDVSIKNEELTQTNLCNIFNEVFNQNDGDGFRFVLDSVKPIRKDDIYGGFQIRINAIYDTLREIVFIDVTTGDAITPHEVEYRLYSIFSEDEIDIMSYNLETVIAEKIETVISRGEASTRPRDRYDLFTLWKIRNTEINRSLLVKAINNTANKRGSLEAINKWSIQIDNIRNSDYQKRLWKNYQNSYKYAKEITFDSSVQIVSDIMDEIW